VSQLTALSIPDPHRLVAAAGAKPLSITRILEGINVLGVAGEIMTDALVLNVPDLKKTNEIF